MGNPRIGLCLSGGGARGIAHIGVIRFLEENNIHAEVVSGASAGSIIGTMYAAGLSSRDMMDMVRKAKMWKVLRFRNPFRGLTDMTYLRSLLDDAIEQDDFSSLKRKMFIAVCNYNTGKLEYKSEGPLLDIVSASCSVPGVFHSVQIDGKLYVDGGVMDNLPVTAIKPHADFIIGMDLVPIVPRVDKKVKYLRGIAIRSFEMMINANTKPNIPLCNVYLAPDRLANYSMASIRPADELFNIGYEAAQNSDLLQKLQQFQNSPNYGE